MSSKKVKHSNPPLVVNPRLDLYRWKVDAYPSLMHAVCCGMTRSPYGWPKSEGFFFGHDFYWYNNWSDIWLRGDKYINKYLQHSRGAIPERLSRKYEAAFRTMRRQIAEIARLDFKVLSLKELRRAWFGFFKAYSHFWFIVTDVEVLSYAASHRLERLISEKNIAISPEEISHLCVFPRLSYALEEEYELLKIAMVRLSAKRDKLLRRHARKFFWILNGYHGVRLASEDFFYGRLRKLIKDKKSRQHYYFLKNYRRATNENFSAIKRKYKLDREIIKYAKLAQQSSFIQDRRKALSWQATQYMVGMYEALARFLGISLEKSLYILWNEFDQAFSEKRQLLIAVAKRQHSCRLRILADRTEIYTGDVKKTFSIFEKRYSQLSSKEIKGTVAYPGKVVGRVQIISRSHQINYFKPDRILVALMTSPDYIAAMKKAKAIVTDDGGLTCHAAIVARELKKPCIVGTRNATRLLKDGDLVEVDANQGTVKIIKKS